MADRVLRSPLVLTEPVFLYGTLCDPELYEIVAGAPYEARAARLDDVSIHWVEGQSFPIPQATDGAVAHGVLVTPDADARARLDFYKIGFGYRVEHRDVATEDGAVRAIIYTQDEARPVGGLWSLEEWQERHGHLTRLAATEYMKLFDTHAPEDAARALPQVQMRAASRVRAGEVPSPSPMAPSLAGTPVIPERTEQPYTDYFAVREDWLSFPRFDGSKGPVVKRASFMGGDAVTVLPYDPALDSVLMIRQFRHGVFSRGDPNPWTLEPAAGRIDPDEMPEDTAARELREETGVEASALHFVGRYYPSPSAYSEFLYSYVAIADLSGEDGGIGGLEEEAEDIMRHVVPLEDALAMIGTGAANTGPLILSLTWLALNKDKLT